MKKIISIIMAATILACCLLSGCGAPANDDAKDKLVVGLDIAFPPMGFQNENNEIVGFDVDLAKAVGEIIGAEVVLTPIDWKSKELELKSGKVDVLWNGYTITEERKKEVLFSDPYLNNRQIIIVKTESPIAKKADLAGGKVGLQTGSTAEDAIMADAVYDSIKDSLMMYDDNNTAMMDLDSGRINAVVVDEVVGKYYLSQHEGKYKILEENFGDELYGVGFRKEDTELRDKVQNAINTLKENGKADEISEKWFGQKGLVL